MGKFKVLFYCIVSNLYLSCTVPLLLSLSRSQSLGVAVSFLREGHPLHPVTNNVEYNMTIIEFRRERCPRMPVFQQ